MPTARPLPFDALDEPPEAIALRFERARRAGHPSYVWPDVPMARWAQASRAVEGAVTALARGDAPPGGPVELAWGPGLDPEERSRATGVAAFTAGVGPLLGRWIEDGRLVADESTTRLLELHLRHGRARAERVGALLRDLATLLAGSETLAVVLKGGHTAWAHFPEPGCRPTADIDLLVGAHGMAAAEAALARAGYTMARRQRRPVRSVWRPPGSARSLPTLEMTHAEAPLTVDLHASLERDFLGVRVVDPPLPHDRDLVPVGDFPTSVLGLPTAHLLLTLALHASEDVHNLQLIRVLELALVGRCGTPAEWHTFQSIAEPLGALRFAWPALSLASRLLPGCVPDALLGRAERGVPPRLRRAVDARTPGTALRLDRLSLEERLMGARGPLELARRFAHMLVPGRAGDSPRELARIYRERAYRLLAGRVRWRGDRDPPRPDE